MSIRLYNTMSRQLEELQPRVEGEIAMYVCGITPYDYPHIGNARAVVVFDIIRRYLEYRGFDVLYVQNFTDIDDKIINRAQEQCVPWQSLPQRFMQVYYEEMDALNVKRASRYPLATEHMAEMITLTADLVAKGNAYAVGGDVYFSVRSYANYGALSGRALDDMQSGARVEVNDIKRDPMDFALWKSAKPGEPSWDSPWGSGRPGWHIECSAMAAKYLGNGFDIHGGGQDLIFPHHENELAQSECAHGTGTFAHYWMHNGFVSVNREKMSKSLGNFFTVREVMEKFPAPVLRYFLTSAHYRSPIDFSDQTLTQAQAAYERLKLGALNISRALESEITYYTPPEIIEPLQALLAHAEDDFRAAMDEDFNTPQALAVLFELVGESNRLISGGINEATRTALTETYALLLRLAGVLGITLEAAEEKGDALTPQLMELLISLRAQARKEKNFALGDAIRDRLAEIGILLEDTARGTEWRRK